MNKRQPRAPSQGRHRLFLCLGLCRSGCQHFFVWLPTTTSVVSFFCFCSHVAQHAAKHFKPAVVLLLLQALWLGLHLGPAAPYKKNVDHKHLCCAGLLILTGTSSACLRVAMGPSLVGGRPPQDSWSSMIKQTNKQASKPVLCGVATTPPVW